MTNKLTSELIQDIYEEAVSAECFERKNVDSACFDLLCKMDEAGGLSHVVRVLIDMARASMRSGNVSPVTPVMFIDGDISPADADKLAAVMREWNSEPVELFAATSPALRDVATERQRQITAEGWTPEHDDEHTEGQLAQAAACYAIFADSQGFSTPAHWPWSPDWWKQSGQRHDLVKAGALILAEIERIDRATPDIEGVHHE